MCDTVGEKTPSWMTDSDFFNDWTECCRKSWKFDLCLSRAPPGAIPETLTEDDTQIIYYAIPSSGKCVEKDEKTPSCKFPVLSLFSISFKLTMLYLLLRLKGWERTISSPTILIAAKSRPGIQIFAS